jgi:hypothetical protein
LNARKKIGAALQVTIPQGSVTWFAASIIIEQVADEAGSDVRITPK